MSIAIQLSHVVSYSRIEGGNSYKPIDYRYINDTITSNESAIYFEVPVAASATGVDINHPQFSDGTNIEVFIISDPATSGAAPGVIRLNRTDSGAVVNKSKTNKGIIATQFETGDTAVTLDNLDDNAITVAVLAYKPQ